MMNKTIIVLKQYICIISVPFTLHVNSVRRFYKASQKVAAVVVRQVEMILVKLSVLQELSSPCGGRTCAGFHIQTEGCRLHPAFYLWISAAEPPLLHTHTIFIIFIQIYIRFKKRLFPPVASKKTIYFFSNCLNIFAFETLQLQITTWTWAVWCRVCTNCSWASLLSFWASLFTALSFDNNILKSHTHAHRHTKVSEIL